jgi:hypothetical protein
MFIARGNRRLGRWSALVAAYAFVLNALLATTLLAATAPAKSLSGFELCTAAEEAVTAAEHADKATKRAAIHCQICLQHTAPAAVAPASGAAQPIPVVRTIVVATPRTEAREFPDGFCSHPPRGPPSLT